MKLNVFGRNVEIVRRNENWDVFYCGNDGKKRKAEDILIPGSIEESELVQYISDLCHEWATSRNSEVKVLKNL
jgi:hypothetical protein